LEGLGSSDVAAEAAVVAVAVAVPVPAAAATADAVAADVATVATADVEQQSGKLLRPSRFCAAAALAAAATRAWA